MQIRSEVQGVDAYYSPEWVADLLVSALPSSASGVVIDPAAGDGALLRSAERRFGTSIQAAAVDVDRETIRRLRRAEPGWLISRADFTNDRSLYSSSVYGVAQRASVSWVLLNPPFSYRGNSGSTITTLYGDFRVARPVLFLWRALEKLRPKGGVVAVLPAGVLDGDRHRDFWEAKARLFTVTEIERLPSRAFLGAVVSSVIVSVVPLTFSSLLNRPGAEHSTVSAQEKDNSTCCCVDIIRGRVPRAVGAEVDSGESSIDMMHTTDLNGLRASNRPHLRASASLASSGVFVVIPRVGNPASFRPAIRSGTFVFSD